MALYTFLPAVGPHPSVTYYLPPTRVGSSNPQARLLTEESSDKVRNTGGSGSWLGAGTGATYHSGGTYTLQFFLSRAWLANNSNANYLASSVSMAAALDAAEADFAAYVAQGGLGTLTDRWLKLAPSTFDTKTCTARIEGQPQWEKMAADSMRVLSASFFCPSGWWTASDGVSLSLFR